jgi:hypothetical protein
MEPHQHPPRCTLAPAGAVQAGASDAAVLDDSPPRNCRAPEPPPNVPLTRT